VSDSSERIASLAQICERFYLRSLQPHLDACSETLRNNGIVDVAVLGQFKAGKSSFLNTLVGNEVLPVNVLPATAVITRIGYGVRDRAIIYLLSGVRKEVPVAELPDFVTEQCNPKNEKQVATVKVELASLAPYRGMHFVDTPGLGSVFTHNTDASMDWLPNVGGAIIAISINQPLSEQDLRLLREVFKYTPEAVILLTKADLVSKRERDVVVEFTQRQIAQHIGRQIPVFPFSTHPNFESFRINVRDYLLRHVVARHEELFTKILGHKVSALISECRAYLQLAQTAATSEQKARSDLREAIGREREEVGTLRKEIRVLTQDLKTRIRTTSAERFHAYYEELTSRLRVALRKDMGSWNGNLAKRTQAFQEWVATALEEGLRRVSENGKAYLGEFLVEAQTSCHRMVRAFQDRLSKEIEKALGISFEGTRFHAEIAEPKRPDVKVGQIFDTHIELLWFVIPMGIFHPLFDRHFLRIIPWEVEKNLSRLATQWAEAVNASVENLASQSLDSIARELTTIEALVSSASDQRTDIADALLRLEELADSETASNGQGETIHAQQDRISSSN
jgi:signal recognition particle receptor subunit beta